jgi:hypothetical protein
MDFRFPGITILSSDYPEIRISMFVYNIRYFEFYDVNFGISKEKKETQNKNQVFRLLRREFR